MFTRTVVTPAARSRSGGSTQSRQAHPTNPRRVAGATGRSAPDLTPSRPTRPTTYTERYESPTGSGVAATVALIVFVLAALGWVTAAVAHRRAWADSGSGPVQHFGAVSDWFALAVVVAGVAGVAALVSTGLWIARSNRNLWAISAGGRLDRSDLARRCWPVAVVGMAMVAVGWSDVADSGLSIVLMAAWMVVIVRALGAIVATLNDVWWRTGSDPSWPPPPVLFRVWAVLAAGGLSVPVWALFLRADPSSIASRDLQILAMVSAICAVAVCMSIIRLLTDRQERAARGLRRRG
jgi:hypothetical protein